MNIAILLAAGSSQRFQESIPNDFPIKNKLFLEIVPGVPLWKMSYDTLFSHPRIDAVGIVCDWNYHEHFKNVGAKFVVEGGNTRFKSSKIGIDRVPSSAEIVLIHDAARPFVTHDLITNLIDAALAHGAAIPSLHVSDTIKKGWEYVRITVPRDDVYMAQTPQAARYDWFLDAYRGNHDYSDDAQALEEAGYRVKMVEGEKTNIKITTWEDFLIAKQLVAQTETRVGIGYDVHSFSDESGKSLRLAGVEIAGHSGLSGHSDADAVIHALVDAMLGASGNNDIGFHFPDSDPAWKDADSMIFLNHALRTIRDEGWQIGNVDLTIITESPKISTYREEMRAVLSEEMNIEQSRINIKATTHEKLGSIGRGEGLAVLCVVTLDKIKKLF